MILVNFLHRPGIWNLLLRLLAGHYGELVEIDPLEIGNFAHSIMYAHRNDT